MQSAFTWFVAESPAALLLLVYTFSSEATKMMNRIESVKREAKLREEALGREAKLREEALGREAKLRDEAVEREAKLRDEALGREVILRDELLKAQLEYKFAMGLKKK